MMIPFRDLLQETIPYMRSNVALSMWFSAYFSFGSARTRHPLANTHTDNSNRNSRCDVTIAPLFLHRVIATTLHGGLMELLGFWVEKWSEMKSTETK